MATTKRTRRKRSTRQQPRRSSFKLKNLLSGIVSLIFFLILWSQLSPATFNAFISWFGITKTVRSNGPYDGIDVSKHQGKIDWETVSQDGNIQFVYIKATEGASLVDKRYERNIKEARKAGMTVGSYHFFNTRRSAAQQFENFRKHVRKDWQDLIPMVDVEESGCRGASRQQLQQSLSEFMELMKSEYGKYPLLYSQYRFYNEKLAPEFNRFFIFMARYSETEPTLRGKGKYNIWQYSERGHVKGIKENVDLDRFANGTSLKDILY